MENLSDLAPPIALAVILVVTWLVLRIALKLTATLFRLGCFIIFLIIAGAFALTFIT